MIRLRLVMITSVLLAYALLQLMPGPGPVPETPGVPGAPETPGVSATEDGAPDAAPPPSEYLPPGGFPSERALEAAAEGAPTPTSGIPPLVVFLLAVLTYLACAVYSWLLRRFPGRLVAQGYLQFSGDLLLVTALIWGFGEISNPFSLLYLLVIGGASILLHRQAGFVIASLGYLLYGFVTLGIYFGRLPGTEAVAPLKIARLTYDLTAHLVAFYAVAFLTYHLAHRVSRVETELKERQEDLATLRVVHRDVVESIQSGLMTTDPDGRVTSVNRAGRKILSLADDPEGRPVHELGLMSPEEWGEMTAEGGSTAVADPSRVRSEVELPGPDGAVHVGYSVSPLKDGEERPQGHIVIFQDLTSIRRLQEQVRLNDRMAAVGELAAGLAHEIGNPLAAISGSVQMLSRREEDPDSEAGRLLRILLNESRRLDRTIKGFLRFARPRERAPARFDVAGLLRENVALLGNSDEAAGHALRLDVTPDRAEIVADPDQISQIFWNLARNALKAMPEGGDLQILGRLSGDVYLLSFRDAGCGMTAEQRARLFHPFQSFFDDGVGLGLAIVYRIVESHGGQITAHDRVGGGTEIVVELPVKPPPQVATGSVQHERSRAS